MFKIPATIAVIFLIAYVLRLDRKQTADVSAGLWIPTLWLMIVSSRPVSFWFDLQPQGIDAEDMTMGSPVDRTVFSLLLLVAIWFLIRSKPDWNEIVAKNRWFIALFIFAGVSLLWSDYPFVSFKRWLRAFGALSAALIVITHTDSFRALVVVVRRVAFVLIPLSLLFIQYYREFGVAYGPWGGMMYTGVTTHKNILGRLCLISILLFTLLLLQKYNFQPFKRITLVFNIGYLFVAIYLLDKANSATSLLTCIIGVGLILTLKLVGPTKSRANILVLGLLPLLLFVALFTNFAPAIVDILERDETFTGRMELWSILLTMRDNVLLGAGYGAFFLGDRLAYLWSEYWWAPTSSHNGYLGVILELGMVGFLLLLGCIVTTYRKAIGIFPANPTAGMFYLSFLIIFLFYNWTETATSLNSMMWFLLSLVGMSLQTQAQPEYQEKKTKAQSPFFDMVSR